MLRVNKFLKPHTLTKTKKKSFMKSQFFAHLVKNNPNNFEIRTISFSYSF